MKKKPFKEIRNEMADISQVNMEEMIREYSEEDTVRLLNVIMKNNMTMLKLQKQILELQVAAEKKRRRQKDREQRRREYEEKREEEEQRRQKEKKEEKERKRVDEEWRRVEEMREEQKKSGDDKRCGKEEEGRIGRGQWKRESVLFVKILAILPVIVGI